MIQHEAQQFWDLVCQSLVQRLPDRTYRDWVLPCVPAAYDGTTLWIQTPSASVKMWIEQQLAEDFHDALVRTDLSHLRLVFTTDDVKLNPKSKPVAKTSLPVGQSGSASDSFSLPQGFDRFTLDSFVVGPNCQLAFSAANAIVENHGHANSSYNMNPLFIYGGSGLGKTHLMIGIGKGLIARNAQTRLAYLKVDKFFHEVTGAIRLRDTEPLRRKYQSNDILLLDDVQVLRTFERTQEEIFYIIEHLLQHGKQIVITSDNPPDRLEGLHDRLVTRCKWGLTVDIQPPDFETRLAILKKKLEDSIFSNYPPVPSDVLSFIANKAKASVRDLEGLLTRVIFQASFLAKDVTLDIAQEAYRGMTGEDPVASVSLERICKITAEKFGIPFSDLIKKKSRRQEILIPRQVAMYLARELTSASYEEIGNIFGNMHHSTVINAISSVKTRMQKNTDFNRDIHGLLNSIS
ncbi:MAG: chromosomal replication initiator protein DnaA [Holophagales bacterium]|jgi:chromosomal replication initiator protein|nr:chromosomal replication initiator protein DnaA [Holophagales bacterium]